jgi:hypothetical protein
MKRIPQDQSKLIITTEGQLTAIINRAVARSLKDLQLAAAPVKEDLLDINGVAKLTGYSKYTIFGFTSSHSIPFFKRGKKLFFSRTDIISWIKSAKK